MSGDDDLDLDEITFEEEALHDGSLVLSAWRRGEKLGYANLIPREGYTYVSWIHVDNRWRRRGVASAIAIEAERRHGALRTDRKRTIPVAREGWEKLRQGGHDMGYVGEEEAQESPGSV